ncbi:MAG: YcjF family protein [Cyanobacteria bacterium]|nr:YcjF family protein [Cyanobacteria bacterium CG_2015-16_32_12]NCO79465.1 YcjF family protein [Cyanobacteria bacterium CG_2015-22_32_23]
MDIVIKKPILVAGISLSFLLWIGQNVKNSLGEMGDFTMLMVTLMGFLWLILQRNKTKKIVTNPLSFTVDSVDFQKKISAVKTLINTLLTESKESNNQDLYNNDCEVFNEKIIKIDAETKRNYLEAIIISDNKVSPITLNKILETQFTTLKIKINTDILKTVENPSINLFESDLILFIIHGDLKESEKRTIQNLVNNNQKLLILFDDIDYNLEEEKTLIFENLKTRLKEIIEDKYIIKISTKNQITKVKKYEDKTNYQEWEEITHGEYKLLTDILQNIIDKDQEKLILLTAYRKLINLQENIKDKLNLIRKEKALPLIEKYQIIAATATFANPVSSLDLLATAAINTQMIVDLSSIYQQSLSLNQAQEISLALGKLMVKLGIVEISSQAITTILKTNFITYVAGGIIQGISAAYLTRICGLSLIEYYEIADFSHQESINLTKIKEKLQLIFQRNKDNNLLTNFVKKTVLQFPAV